MNATERSRVINDIACWKVEEVEVGAGEAFTDAELADFVAELKALGAAELESFWVGTVGEWVASRRDVPEEPVEERLERVKRGDRNWGYITLVSIGEVSQ